MNQKHRQIDCSIGNLTSSWNPPCSSLTVHSYNDRWIENKYNFLEEAPMILKKFYVHVIDPIEFRFKHLLIQLHIIFFGTCTTMIVTETVFSFAWQRYIRVLESVILPSIQTVECKKCESTIKMNPPSRWLARERGMPKTQMARCWHALAFLPGTLHPSHTYSQHGLYNPPSTQLPSSTQNIC